MTLEGYLIRHLLSRSLLTGLLLAAAVATVNFATTGPLWASRVGWGVVTKAALLHLPLHLALVMPLSILLSGALLIAGLARRGELEAISACGAHPLRLGAALGATGLTLAIATLAVTELLVPPCEASAAQLYDFRRASSLTGARATGNWYTGPDGWLVQLAATSPGSGPHNDEPSAWVALRLDADHRLIARLTGTLDQGRPTVTRTNLRQLSSTANRADTKSLFAFLAELRDTAEALPAEALPLQRLWQRAARARSRGRSTRADELMLQVRLAFPLFCLLSSLLVWAMAIGRGRDGTARLLRSAVGWGFALWLLIALGWQLAQAHLLSATAGVWAPVALAATLTTVALAMARTKSGSLAP